jgi:tripartite-type tricarboxylate transporter receptor subunit TctC
MLQLQLSMQQRAIKALRNIKFVSLFCLLVCTSIGFSQYPEQAIEFVIPFDAGGGADIEGRLLADQMSNILDVPVVPVNKPGAGGAVAYTYLMNAAPNGYVVIWNSTSILTITNLGYVPFTYDEMDHIGRVEFQPLVLAVSTNSPWSDLESFATDCASGNSVVRLANSGTGSGTHLGALSIASAIGCEAVHLPIGTRRRNAAVLSGEADGMIAPLTGVINLVKANRLRILATLSAERNSVIPDVPTATELGVNSLFDLFRGLSVPKGTPKEVIQRLADAMIKAAASEEFTGFSKDVGFTIEPMAPTAFQALLAAENDKVKMILDNAGFVRSNSN